MKRYLKYILLALISVALAVSCIEELEPTPSMTANDEVAVLVPRIKSFTNQYVTRSDYSEAEMTISSLKVLVFNNDSILVHHDDIPVDSRTISLNKSMLNSPAYELTNATVVMLANMDLSRLKKDNKPLSNNLSYLKLSLSDLENYSYSHEQSVYTSLPSGFKGFPMIGGTTGVDLSPTSSSNPQEPVIVDLKILYAKVNFEISVEQGGENQRVDPLNAQQMQFYLDNYAVFNASAVTALAIPTTEGEPVRDFLGNIPDAENIASVDEPTLSSTYSYPASGSGATHSIGKTVALGGASIPFTFYIAESRYNHNLASLEGIYPDKEWLTSAQNDDVKGWETLTKDQKKLPQNKLNGVKYLYDDLIQQYKPKLANVGGGLPGPGLASFVRLTGKYTDYRGTVWNVNYDVYLGKDNSQNFHVDRNSEYTNIITIKGLRNNDSYGEEQVWFDHRVDVSLASGQGADDHVTITRETLLDAHIEVRPLRVKWDGDKYAGVRIYLPTDKNGNLLNWIGIERFITGANCQDSATYCYADGESTGKRRYFTSDLISELQTKEGDFGVSELEDGKKVIYLLNGECAWIYFDENTFTGTSRNSARTATIRLEFLDDNSKVEVTEDYIVTQQGLLLKGGLNVESYEEYLHSYDSADKYNLSTSPADYTQQGLAWGFADQPISQDVIVSRAEIGSDIIKDLAEILFPDQKYDYFTDTDTEIFDGNFYRYIKDGDWSLSSGFTETGRGFTNRATRNNNITIMDMGSVPENAYQYCLSKNKFEADDEGKVSMTLHWYLPDVHQLGKVLNDIADGSSDFRSGDFYWSSQPSFTFENTGQNYGLVDEVEENARARSKGGDPEDFHRTSKNRIRCLYSRDGEPADITRTPDGIGGIVSVIMKGHDNSNYFNYMVSSLESHPGPADPDDHDYQYNNNTYPWPTFANPGTDFGFLDNVAGPNNATIRGFSEDPASKSSWSEYLQPGTNNLYYYTLYTFSGLSPYQIEKASGVNASRETTNLKQDTKIETTANVFELEKNLHSSADELKPLDKDKKLNITFDIRDNTKSNYPQFKYYANTDGSKRVTTTKHWRVPTYPKVSLDPENPFSDTKEYQATATKKYSLSNLTSVRNQARKDALDAAIKKAKDEYPGAIYSNGTPEYEEDTYRKGLTLYIDVTCTVEVTASNYYYQDATNGGWYIADEKTEFLDGVETDELRIYGGNSFTISLSDNLDENGLKYSEAYEITKVKVYYSGSNQISSTPGLGSTTTYLARFVDSVTAANLPKAGEESDHMMGVEYSESDGWQQWSGIGCNSVTLVLADYKVVSSIDLGGFLNGNFVKYNYTYQKAAGSSLDKHLVIDRIEVKCTKKATASE